MKIHNITTLLSVLKFLQDTFFEESQKGGGGQIKLLRAFSLLEFHVAKVELGINELAKKIVWTGALIVIVTSTT